MSKELTMPRNYKLAQQTLDAEAAQWLVVIENGEPDEQLLAEFDEWLALSSAHREAYLEAELVADDLIVLGNSEYANDIRQMAEQKTGVGEWLLNQWRSLFLGSYGLGAGVAALMVLMVGFWLLSPVVLNNSNVASKERRIVSTQGDNMTLQLEDGSTVILGPRSEIVFRLEAQRRHLVLVRGDAFFDIAKNPDKPFFVYADSVVVKVVGTRFDVRKQPSGISVGVVEGLVQVSDLTLNAKSAPVTLQKGQRARRAGDSYQLDVEKNISASELASWSQRRLVYNRVQLQDILADANRYSKSGRLLMTNDTLLKEQVTLSLNVDELDDLPQMLAQLLSLEVKEFMDNTFLVVETD